MRIVCAWCGNIIKSEGPGESHGLCHPCFTRIVDEDESIDSVERSIDRSEFGQGGVGPAASSRGRAKQQSMLRGDDQLGGRQIRYG